MSLSNKRQRTSYTTTLVLEQQLESLQAELDHERSLRSLDQRRARQEQEQLTQKVSFAAEEAKSAKALLEEFETRSNDMTAKLRRARDDALAHARALQLQLDQSHHDIEDDDEDDHDSHWRIQCDLLERKLEAKTTQEARLLEELQELRDRPAATTATTTLASETTASPARLMEDAPPDLLKEMQRLRIQVAEGERQQRQMQRQLTAAERRHLTATREREQAMLQAKGLPALRQAYEELQRKHEMALQQHKSWDEFGKRLEQHLERPSVGVPPEVSTVLRKLEKGKEKVEELERSLTASRKKTEALQVAMKSHELSAKEFQEKERQWSTEREEWKQKVDTSQRESQSRQRQIQIFQREAESLRALVKTFEDLPLAPGGGSSESASAAKIALAATEQQRDVIQKERDQLSQQLASLTKSQGQQRQELDRVREKFIKLRDALQNEKEKVAAAEARANQAEALAGSGSFNPDRTRVLHLEETPMIHSLKEEIAVLKRQIASKGDQPGSSKHDPDKLNQRLKQNFKEQIALFREGVYLMTGYKVDMLHSNPQERPTFRVRSMYAEREEDHLLLKWPQSEASSLNILGTEMAKVLSKTPSYDYMTKFRSLPAFLASVQLSLFEKQTVMM